MASKDFEETSASLYWQLQQGRISRRQFMQGLTAAGLGAVGASVLAACGTPAPVAAPTAAPVAPTTAPAAVGRPLTPTFYQWIEDLHPGIKSTVNPKFAGLNYQIAPTQGFDVARFIAEAKTGESTWDVYVGVTPFVEMGQLIASGAIEPWDPYLPQGLLDDLIPAIREECSVDGKLYVWPFLLDVIVEAQNNAILSAAGLPDKIPADWDEYLAGAKTVMDKGAAKYGCTFDAHGWRSLAPITHSISTQCYYNLEGDKTGFPLYDFTSEPALQALEVMKKMLELSSANALQPGSTDAGVNQTPDEVAFAAELVAYYIKYQNAPLRFAEKWKDPTQFRMGALPKAKGGEGGTAFWDTGASLFKYGKNKEKAAEYLKALTYEPQIWKDSIAGSSAGHPGQLPPYKSIYAGWEKDKPDWLAKEAWVPLVRGGLDNAKAIPNHQFGLTQFQIGQPIWEKYLKGEETDPKKVMQECKDAVVAEIKKAGCCGI
ncbi:MAG: ABC transporter substrate-binding protein [Anaerolineae bacterium CG2_30_64_16]|nr:MAG: ABC transporter substrate-binding protein [Anaerolineae bacterium CG2_30_64_16]